jgi:hypothetical protein
VTEKALKVLRTLPVEWNLHEVEIEGGDRAWVLSLSAVVDEREVIAAVKKPLIGGGHKTPDEALASMADQPLGMFGL